METLLGVGNAGPRRGEKPRLRLKPPGAVDLHGIVKIDRGDRRFPQVRAGLHLAARTGREHNMARGTIPVLGVYPAPRKLTVVFDGQHFYTIAPHLLRTRLRELLPVQGPALVVWNAPLSSGHDGNKADFWGRPVDEASATWIDSHTKHLCDKALSAQPFVGRSHRELASHVLGLPFSDQADRFRLVAKAADVVGPRCAIETQSAMVLAKWWGDRKIETPKLWYTGSRSAAQAILHPLAPFLAANGACPLPPEDFLDEDHLDAWVSWRVGMDFMAGRAGTGAQK